MELLSLFGASFAIALTGALSPGPFLAGVISESTRHGFKSGPLMIVGHAILEIGMVGVIAGGLSPFLRTPLLIRAAGIAGAVILVFFGVSMMLSLPRLKIDLTPQNRPSSSLILAGITLSLSNPYWTIWWLTIGFSLVLAASDSGLLAVCVFFLGHIFADLLWYSIVAFIISRGKRFFSLKVYKAIIFVCALTLVGFGTLFGIRALFLRSMPPPPSSMHSSPSLLKGGSS